ncbi:hypothetical protein FI667_g13601, partial [Globisporangium splendens]
MWYTWKDTKQQRHTRVTMVTARKEQILLGAIWQRWGCYVHYCQANAEIAARALRHFVHTCLHKHWYQRVHDRKALQCLTARVSNTIKCTYQRRIGMQLLQARERRLVRMVWIQWCHVLHRAHRDRHARQHYQFRSRSRSLIAWYHVTQESKFRRQEQAGLALRHFEWSLRRRTLNVWRYAMRDQQKKRFSLLSCMVKLASISGKRMLEVIWHSWRRWAERERRCRVLQFTLERNLEKRAFVSWHQRVAEKLKRKQQRRDAECYYTNRLVSVLFFYWQNYALAWKDVTEANSKLNSAPPMRRSRLRLNVAAVDNEFGMAADGDDAGDEDDEDDLVTRVRPLSPVMKRLRLKNQARFDADTAKEEQLRHAENASGAAAEISITVRNKTYTCSGTCTKFSPLMISFSLCAAAFVLGSCRALDRCEETAGGARQKVLQSIQGSVLLQFCF